MSTGKYAINGISGIWNSYGCIPEDGKSVSISLEDNESGDESLIDLCGFDRKPQQIGVIADSKEISELVVILPMLTERPALVYNQPDDQPVTPPVEDCQECPEKDPCSDTTFDNAQTNIHKKKYLNFYYSKTDNAYLFQIRPEIINKILGVQDYKTLSIQFIKQILEQKVNINKENSIVKLMIAMANYNFPPHLNWLLFKNVPPIGMYVAEFKHILKQKDLSNIWQGTMPDISEDPEEEEIEIEHFLGDEEIFDGYDLNKHQDIKMRVFKCKKRAKNDYKRDVLIGSETPGTNYKFNEKWYQSNWPYDNFSLVELLRVEAGEVSDTVNNQKYGVLLPSSTSVNPDGTVTLNYTDAAQPYGVIGGTIKDPSREY